MNTGPIRSPRLMTLLGLLTPVAVLVSTACVPSSAVDPRCVIDAEGRHHDKLAQLVNGSELWQTYFDVIDPTATRNLAEFQFTADRTRFRSVGGDYDPGKITVVFRVTNLTKHQNLYTRSEEVDLEPFMIGFFNKDATRDELTEVAFKAMEDRIYPYLGTWVDIAAIRAMGQEGSGGYEFEDMLQKLLDDRWSNLEIQTACRDALAKIRG